MPYQVTEKESVSKPHLTNGSLNSDPIRMFSTILLVIIDPQYISGNMENGRIRRVDGRG